MLPWTQEWIEKYNKIHDPDGRKPYLRCTESMLFNKVASDVGYSDAYEILYGHNVLDQFPDDWRELALQLRTKGKSLDYISLFCRMVYMPRQPTRSEIHRLVSPEAAAKQRQYDMAYHWRNREARCAAMREQYHKNKQQ